MNNKLINVLSAKRLNCGIVIGKFINNEIDSNVVWSYMYDEDTTKVIDSFNEDFINEEEVEKILEGEIDSSMECYGDYYLKDESKSDIAKDDNKVYLDFVKQIEKLLEKEGK